MKPTHLTSVNLEKGGDIATLRQIALTLTTAMGFASFERTRTVTAAVELARNAIEHGQKGRARFSLTEVDGKLALGLTVIDQGRGIEKEKLDPTRDIVSTSGMGLGLRGVQRIAARFDVDTGPEGTRVHAEFLLPDCQSDAAEIKAKAQQALDSYSAKDPTAALTEQNRELSESIADRDLLMQELHHRTGNNLALIVALIRMSKSQAKAEETRQVLRELETRVGSLSKAHELMQRSTATTDLDLADMLDEVAKNAERAFTGGDQTVGIKLNCPPLLLDNKLAVDIGLIVGELITNAYKHAFVGRERGLITIAVKREDDDGLTLRVFDDGVGLPEDAPRPERSNSLGWRMIRTLTFQHEATLSVRSDDGLSVDIRFPPMT
ncbi:ATP-binding protein [Sulfitobacter sp. S0837]|uniref:sensor histidine kinase n=1 Tax=Sulfitobacter maritimus TaxID=2741719 RepID=UPI001583FAE5|nr:ATP-binding protein [Sulfitobacter maritimus]NUH65448.1 ATP-binding protein [Sulfitobacter maritimus]